MHRLHTCQIVPTAILGSCKLSTPSLSHGVTFVKDMYVHQCNRCHIILLTGERPGFCCGTNGSHVDDIPLLPPLPPEYNAIINHPDISRLSRILNLIFSLASLESSHPFPTQNGPQAFFAVQGKLYSHVQEVIAHILFHYSRVIIILYYQIGFGRSLKDSWESKYKKLTVPLVVESEQSLLSLGHSTVFARVRAGL